MTTPSPLLGRIRQVALPVRDLDRAIAFYRDRLGLPFLFRAPPGLAFFDCHGLWLMLSAPEGDAAGTGAPLYFEVSDLEAAWRTLTARGVAFEKGPHLIADLGTVQIWMAFFRDPDGNVLALRAERPTPG